MESGTRGSRGYKSNVHTRSSCHLSFVDVGWDANPATGSRKAKMATLEEEGSSLGNLVAVAVVEVAVVLMIQSHRFLSLATLQ